MSNLTNLTARTVFLRLYPTPRTFSERREVLRVLERFGEVSMFKSHQYSPRTPTPSTFSALFASSTAAEALLNASPIRYRLISHSNLTSEPPNTFPTESNTPQEASHSNPSEPVSSETPPTDSQHETSNETTPQKEGEEPNESPFELRAFPSTFDHRLYLTSPIQNPLHGPFKPVPPELSYIGSSLAQIIPRSMSYPGLLDWKTDASRETPGTENERRSGGANAAYFFEVRERARLASEIPSVMKGLRPLRRQWEMRDAQALDKAVEMGEAKEGQS